MDVTADATTLLVCLSDIATNQNWRRLWHHVNPKDWQHMQAWLREHYHCRVETRNLLTGFYLIFDDVQHLTQFVLTWG